MKDFDWLVPSSLLTAASGLISLSLMPNYSSVWGALTILPRWMLAAAVIGIIYGFGCMLAASEPSPAGRARRFFCEERRTIQRLALFIFVAGLNMTTFMWTKPLLNQLVPFRADPVLANIDRALFLGTDPWRLLTFLNTDATALFYHRIWFALILLTLLVVFFAPRSPQRSAAMLTYFLLWSVVGPLIHIMIPAAGPIFYAHLGYGDRFSGLQHASETRELADYLWTLYSTRGFGAGAGISAMPSLHIATTVWMLVCTRQFAPRLVVPMTLCAILIFFLSIALGWHYAADGIVGAAATLGCYRLSRRIFELRADRGWWLAGPEKEHAPA